MKKVFIYEPESGGHHDVVLSYLIKYLPNYGWVPTVNRDRAIGGRNLFNEIQNAAHGHDLIHLSGVDGRWIDLARGPLCRHARIPVVANWFQYDRSDGFYGRLAFQLLRRRNALRAIFGMNADQYPWRLPKPSELVSVVDPWEDSDFKVTSEFEARTILNLPHDVKIGLLFGDLSLRKGVSTVIEALEQHESLAYKILFVGQPAPNLRPFMQRIRNLSDNGRVLLREGYVPEEQVGRYFSAASFILCPYPSFFRVSSGTFIRGCAAGKPIIVPSHGVLANLSRSLELRFSFRSDSCSSLAEVLASVVQESKEEADRRRNAQLRFAALNTAKEYVRQISQGYAVCVET